MNTHPVRTGGATPSARTTVKETPAMYALPLPLPAHEPSLDERMERLAGTVEAHSQALRRIERGILLLLDDAAALRVRIDAALPEAGAQ